MLSLRPVCPNGEFGLCFSNDEEEGPFQSFGPFRFNSFGNIREI